MSDLFIRRVTALGHGRCDVLIQDGRIARIGSLAAPPDVEVLDGAGQVLLPGFVDAHSHLDKSLLGRPWYRREPSRDLQRMLADERDLRRSPDWDYEQQIGTNVDVLIASGVTHTRAFVDVDTDAGLRGLEAMLAIKHRYADALTIHVVAFAQSGVSGRPGTAELLDQALANGADCIGGIDPCLVERDPVAHLDLVFGLAQRHGSAVDIHLHEPGPLGAFSASLIIERTRATGLGGKVVISHPDFLGGIPAGQASALIEQLVDAGVAVTTNVSAGDPKPPLREMLAAGLAVGAGCDGERDSWAPFNRSDMLLKTNQLAWRHGLGTDDELELALRVATTGGAAVMGVTDHGLAPGCRADLVLVPGEVVVEPVVAVPAERTVVKGGAIVSRPGSAILRTPNGEQPRQG
ncbi:amidohydrolase [Kribbella sp. NPDC004875]|uniref:amidohydrolase n=1 Tax=Kribbella sp. NPDC004875 TaxID=3364107 RepID=UPI0036BBBF54